MDKPIPEAVTWPLSILEAGNWREVYMGTKHMRLEVSYPYEVWERLMAALAAAQQQGQAVAWQDEWRAAVAAKLSGYGLSEEAAAVFAESELGEYRAGLCDCAENDPADMVDLMMGVALDAIEKWKAESAGRPFGYKRTAPPSAPVGVEDVVMAARNAENAIRNCAAAGQIGEGYVQYADDLRDAVQRLAQQPAAGVGEEIMVNAAHDVYTLPLQPSGLLSGPRFVVHVPAPEQPAAVDGAAVERALAAYLRRQEDGDSLYGCVTAALTAALATKHQEPKKSKAKA